jgi:SAM-dependent methyltransferase
MSSTATICPDPSREEEELRRYLGPAYDRTRLQESQRFLHDEFRATGDEKEFYRTSQAYLYDLTAFAMTGTKLPYLNRLTELVPVGSRVLDYGCGIGSDGLLLLEAGYRVEFADFANPSTEYLAWRLRQRNLGAPIHDLEVEVPGGFDAAYSFDVIEHVPDAFAFLDAMESRACVVAVNLLEFDEHEQELHYELPIHELLAHIGQRTLILYEILHGSSHFVIYDPTKSARLRAARQGLRIRAERIRHRKS